MNFDFRACGVSACLPVCRYVGTFVHCVCEATGWNWVSSHSYVPWTPAQYTPLHFHVFFCLITHRRSLVLPTCTWCGDIHQFEQVSRSPQLLHLSVWDRQDLSLNLELVDWLDWLARELQICLSSFSPTHVATPTPPAFTCVLGIHIQTSCSYSKHLTRWLTQAPEIWIFLQ